MYDRCTDERSNTYRECDEDNHERTLRNSAGMAVGILREEEQRSQTDLLQIQSHKYVMNSLGEEKSTGLL